MSTKERTIAVNDFQNGAGDVFLISLRAGGMGLNLTAADYVIHLDPWWNPAVEQQAVARAYRLGQDHELKVYRLLIENSIESNIQKLQKDKSGMFASLFDHPQQKGTKEHWMRLYNALLEGKFER